MKEKTNWKVGELAKQTGLSVRTLHYYDQVGLIVLQGIRTMGIVSIQKRI